MSLANFTEIETSRDELIRACKQAADLIRTRVDYKYILVLLFLKKLSDEWKKEYSEAFQRLVNEEGLSEEQAKEIATDKSFHHFAFPEKYTWDELRKNVNELPVRLSKALKLLAEKNPELQGVVDRLDFLEFTRHPDSFEILWQLFELFSGLNLGRESDSILGDAYEWIISYFAPQKAKEGEVFTPSEVVELIVRIADPKPMQSVYDPAAGYARMLIRSYDHVKKHHGEEVKKLFLYGQEVSGTTFAIAKMNAIVHGIKDLNLAVGDTLKNPRFKEADTYKKYDIVIANPPWNQDGYGEEDLKKAEFYEERFSYGFTSKQSADWAWIQHMLASANQKVGVVIDNGCLFRGGKEKSIRKAVVEDDLLDCVILLPEKLFYNTGAPGAILIFNKNKPEKRKNKILFINASSEYEQHPEVRKLNRLGEEHIKKIVDAYNKFEDGDSFCRVVSMDEINENDFNLNVTLYVFPEEDLEEIDVAKEWKELESIEKDLKDFQDRIKEYLEEINYFKY